MKPLFWIWGAILLGIAFVLSIDPHHPGQSLCFSQTFFGFACPACGMGRAFHSLFHFHITEAVAFNPLVVPAFFYVLALMSTSLFDVIRKTDYTSKLMRFKWSWPVAIIAIIVVAAVWIRNLQIY